MSVGCYVLTIFRYCINGMGRGSWDGETFLMSLLKVFLRVDLMFVLDSCSKELGFLMR